MVKKLLLIPAVMVVAVFATSGVAVADHNEQHEENEKVTICHATNAVDNPWTRPEVDQDAVNDGDPNDHAGHTGPIPTSEAEAQALKDAKIDWGDIIPPFEGFAGLNWTTDGQAIYNNNCQFTTTTPGEPGRGGGDPTVIATSTPQVDAPKVVRAGNGAVAGVAALLTASVASIALGVRRLLASR